MLCNHDYVCVFIEVPAIMYSQFTAVMIYRLAFRLEIH